MMGPSGFGRRGFSSGGSHSSTPGLSCGLGMETLELLGTAVGLASLAGINLYLTVFLTGLAVRFHWIALSPEYARLEVLGDPAVLIVAGALFAVEFLADKVPWVDSAWDAVHTAIRPVGAAFLAVMVLGEHGHNPAFNAAVALLAAGLGFTTHALKATVRLQANASPEPVSNVVLSLAGDTTVALGLGLIFTHPVIALVVAVLFLAAIWYFVPRMLRSTWVKLWLCVRKLRLAPDDAVAELLPDSLPRAARPAITEDGRREIAWAVPCISGSVAGCPRNRFGWLAVTDGLSPAVYFVLRHKPHKPRKLAAAPPDAARIEKKFLADVLVLEWPAGRATFLFDRGSRALAQLAAEKLAPPAAASEN